MYVVQLLVSGQWVTANRCESDGKAWVKRMEWEWRGHVARVITAG